MMLLLVVKFWRIKKFQAVKKIEQILPKILSKSPRLKWLTDLSSIYKSLQRVFILLIIQPTLLKCERTALTSMTMLKTNFTYRIKISEWKCVFVYPNAFTYNFGAAQITKTHFEFNPVAMSSETETKMRLRMEINAVTMSKVEQKNSF